VSAAKDQVVVSEQDVRQIASLARLSLDERTIEALTGELNGILEHVRVLETLPSADMNDGDRTAAEAGSAVVRDPSARPDSLPTGSVERIAPDWREGFFVVPRLPALDRDAAGESEA
jgi:aspartyl/glutamyl-tRNA(Asn/Gln) amidotransferase C subunit